MTFKNHVALGQHLQEDPAQIQLPPDDDEVRAKSGSGSDIFLNLSQHPKTWRQTQSTTLSYLPV
jgi:hypothetical protein